MIRHPQAVTRIGRLLRRLALAPWQNSIDLDVEREAQHSPDQDDYSEDSNVGKRRLHGHRPNEISYDENLEADENPASQDCATSPVGDARGEASLETARHTQHRKREREDQHRD